MSRVSELGLGEESLVGRVVAERYRIREQLGEGGMGVVYLAEHVHMKKPFAVKVLHRDLTAVSEVVARFEREAVAAGLIDHPCVAKASDFGRLPDGSFFLVLEYVEGESLADALRRERPFSQERALLIARQVTDALAAAHAAGVVHRDLKPDNVMLIERGAHEQVKVLDFGIAKLDQAEGPALTQVGTVFGTPQYMAPEQAAGQAVDSRADLYTSAMILYEMLSGVLPFDGDEVGAVLAKQITVTPPPLPESIDPELRELVLQQLAKRAAERIQTADEVLSRMDAILARWAEAPGSTLRSHPEMTQPSLSGLPPRSTESARSDTLLVTPERRLPDLLRAAPRVPVPYVALGGGAVVVFLAGALFSALLFWIAGGAPEGVAAAEPAASVAAVVSAEPPDPGPQIAALLASAAAGDPEALAKLEERPAAGRGAREWLALGRGRTLEGRIVPGLEAYEQALKLDPSLAKDQALVSHVRVAAGRADSGNLAIAIAERHLGGVGADLLYDVWVATKAKNEQTQLARSVLFTPEMQAKASPALKAALELREAATCQDYKKVLPAITLHGDTRTIRVLQRLTERRGCGFLKRGDCYPCLRSDNALSDAIAAAKKRPEPQF
ncbi:MAG: serine/threonine protein kinase [Polyangiaceae bacterium]|nr:serine/threonine protein kinase [Polyangiaceae bacterium]MCW5791820.1 serine/threonine protein kinase [Polyangiaceae bacterium]